MALRNQPYIPLYVQDYLTDEKLNMCSLETQGFYIKLMCILHKSEEYGIILLKQRDKQNKNIALNFAVKISKQLPIQIIIIEKCLLELVDENVILIENDKLIQKRMVKDNSISEERAKSGKKGGVKTQSFAKAKVKAKSEDVNEDEYVNKDVNVNIDLNKIIDIYNDVCLNLPKVQKLTKQRISALKARMKEYSLAQIGDVIQNTADSNFLNGKNNRGWKADFDWIINPNNFIKILEGNYKNINNGQSKEQTLSNLVGDLPTCED